MTAPDPRDEYRPERYLVGVLVDEQKPVTQWADHILQPVAVLPGVPETAPWTVLGPAAYGKRFYAGTAELVFHRTETANYRDNLLSGAPKIWVVLRATGVEPPHELFAVTADPAEGEAFTEIPGDIVETVPMPADIAAALAAFVDKHHVERVFTKRRRDEYQEDGGPEGFRSRVRGFPEDDG